MLKTKMRSKARQSIEEKLAERRAKHANQLAIIEQAERELTKLIADGVDAEDRKPARTTLEQEQGHLRDVETDIAMWQKRLAELDEQEAHEALIADYKAVEAERKEVERLIASPTLENLLPAMFREEAFDAKRQRINKRLPEGYPPITFRRFDPYGDGRGIPLRKIVLDLAKIIERREQMQSRLAQLPPDRNGRFVEVAGDLHDELKAMLESALKRRPA